MNSGLPWDPNVPQLGPEAQAGYVANILAQQTLAASITRAWERASPELREEFAKALLSWCISYLHQTQSAFVAHRIVDLFATSGNLMRFLSDEKKTELAEAIQKRMVYMATVDNDALTWEERSMLKDGILAAARAELAAAGRELGVEAMAAKPEPAP